MTRSTPLVALGALLLGTLLGYYVRDSFVGSPAVGPGGGSKGLEPRVDEVSLLRAENQRLVEKLRTAEAAAARQPAESGKEADRSEADGAAKSTVAAADASFQTDEFREVLGKIDWKKVGETTKDLVPVLAGFAEAIAEGERPDLNEVAKMQRLNAELVNLAALVSDAGVPGAEVNGAFTHPVIAANQMDAALSAAGVALTPEQKAALNRAMSVSAAKDKNLREAEPSEIKLADIETEAMLKNEFYQQARQLMTEEQRKAIYNGSSEGYGGVDLFDTGLMLSQFARPLNVKSAADLATSASGRYTAHLGLKGEATKQLEGVIAEWSKQYGDDYWAKPANKLEQSRMMKSSRVRTALQRQLALTRAILKSVDLTPEQRRKLVENRQIFVPLPRD